MLCETKEKCKRVFEHFIQDFFVKSSNENNERDDFAVRRPLFRISIK